MERKTVGTYGYGANEYVSNFIICPNLCNNCFYFSIVTSTSSGQYCCDMSKADYRKSAAARAYTSQFNQNGMVQSTCDAFVDKYEAKIKAMAKSNEEVLRRKDEGLDKKQAPNNVKESFDNALAAIAASAARKKKLYDTIAKDFFASEKGQRDMAKILLFRKKNFFFRQMVLLVASSISLMLLSINIPALLSIIIVAILAIPIFKIIISLERKEIPFSYIKEEPQIFDHVNTWLGSEDGKLFKEKAEKEWEERNKKEIKKLRIISIVVSPILALLVVTICNVFIFGRLNTIINIIVLLALFYFFTMLVETSLRKAKFFND